jgi:very-short-patch-repair endonuclease
MPDNPAKSKKTNSPPSKGGVSAGRGGCGQSGREVDSKINNLPHLKPFRKALRNNLTPAEAGFWKIIQNKNLEGRKFRRQHSVGSYILDFYCPAEKLAIELDGEVHFNDSARERDGERKLYLQSCGIRVLRFENKRVFEDLEWMLDVIKSNFGWNKTAPIAPETTPHPSDAAAPFKGGEFVDDESGK